MDKTRSRVAGIVGRSLMFRVLLPTGALLVAMVAGSVVGVAVKNSDTARATLSAKTKLIADIAGRGTVDAIWNLDAKLAKASLAALAADLDYVGSELSDDHGALLAADGAKQTESGTLIV
jgi:methyl-accepting chemotaxis protein